MHLSFQCFCAELISQIKAAGHGIPGPYFIDVIEIELQPLQEKFEINSLFHCESTYDLMSYQLIHTFCCKMIWA